MDPEQFQVLQEKLDAIIRLLAHNIVGDLETQREKVAYLDSLGLKPKPIAEILNITPNQVHAVLSQLRKQGASSRAEPGKDKS